jgi:hypothetical protein
VPTWPETVTFNSVVGERLERAVCPEKANTEVLEIQLELTASGSGWRRIVTVGSRPPKLMPSRVIEDPDSARLITSDVVIAGAS